MIEPVVSVPVVRLENVLETALKIVVKNEVEVACVNVADEVPVIVPTVKFPTVDDEVIEPPRNAIGEDVAE